MSGKRGSSGKISLAMLKGKPITTSVPSFAVRFHTEGEELEELYPSADEDTGEKEDMLDDPSSASQASTPSSSTTPQNATPSRDPSPMKEYIQKFGKRSTSLDSGNASLDNTIDAWSLISELKGKITKTVEEKFSEIKTDKKSAGKGSEQDKMSGSISKDSLNVSESEDCVQSLSLKEVELLEGGEGTKNEMDAQSQDVRVESVTPSGNCDVPVEKNQGDVDAEEKLKDEGDIALQEDAAPKKKFGHIKDISLRNKIRPKLIELRQRHIRSGLSKSPSVSMSSLCACKEGSLEDFDAIDEEVESGIEVKEETLFGTSEPPSLIGVPNRGKHVCFEPHLCNQRIGVFGVLKLIFMNYYVAYFSIIVLAYSVIPMPAFLSGLIVGVMISAVVFSIWQWLCYPGELKQSFSIPDYSSLPILTVPAAKEHQPSNRFEGWINEYPGEYNPDIYHVRHTQSVYVCLEGTLLLLYHTRSKIPKRAMWNEPKHNARFFYVRTYDISGCEIKLLPEGLIRKRLWSKKYPICIILKAGSKVNSVHIPKEEDVESMDERVASDDKSKSSSSKMVKDHSTDSDDKSIGSDNMSKDDSVSEDESYYHVADTEEKCLYFLTRTDREKDDWYRRLAAAAKQTSTSKESSFSTSLNGTEPDSKSIRSIVDTPTTSKPPDVVSLTSTKTTSDGETESHKSTGKFLQQVHKLRGQISASVNPSAALGPGKSGPKSKKDPGKEEQDKGEEKLKPIEEDPQASPPETLWVNALVGRILPNVLRDKFYVEKIQEKIQKKLATIKLPYFMEDLIVSELEIGRASPIIHRVSKPAVDERGLWIDMDITYNGTARMSLETKLNLMKLKKASSLESNSGSNRDGQSPTEKSDSRSPMFHSSLEDSAESSSDEDAYDPLVEPHPGKKPSGGKSAKKKILRMVDKITSSRYFQQATEYRYIKKAMEGVSNTRLLLSVEMKAIVGTLVLNVPPQPCDRIWYGFRGNPKLWLSAKPKLGERQVTITHVTEWIERKLGLEFQKVFVLPNMDDFVIPGMTSRMQE